jgi:hypothetical protein
LTLYVQSHFAEGGMALGTASAYYSAPAGNDTVQTLSSDITSGTGAGVLQTSELVVGGVYTVFLFDVAQPPIIFEDR